MLINFQEFNFIGHSTRGGWQLTKATRGNGTRRGQYLTVLPGNIYILDGRLLDSSSFVIAIGDHHSQLREHGHSENRF